MSFAAGIAFSSWSTAAWASEPGMVQRFSVSPPIEPESAKTNTAAPIHNRIVRHGWRADDRPSRCRKPVITSPFCVWVSWSAHGTTDRTPPA